VSDGEVRKFLLEPFCLVSYNSDQAQGNCFALGDILPATNKTHCRILLGVVLSSASVVLARVPLYDEHVSKCNLQRASIKTQLTKKEEQFVLQHWPDFIERARSFSRNSITLLVGCIASAASTNPRFPRIVNSSSHLFSRPIARSAVFGILEKRSSTCNDLPAWISLQAKSMQTSIAQES
jgi:hypothetical protein